MTQRNIVDLVQDAASDPVIYRELDTSVTAALADDPVPLLRLAAQSGTYDHGTSTPDYFSDGLYFAVSCVDYPQLFRMSSTPAQRRTELAASIASPPAGNPFAPFTSDEWLQMSAYDEPYMACLDWPQPAHTAPPVPAGSKPLPASVPVLILGGELDSLTPEPDVEKFGPTLGAHVRIVKLANAVHVSSEGIDARRAATVAAGALGDAIIRRFYSGVDTGPGLRGGSFVSAGQGEFKLSGVRFVSDAPASGTGEQDAASTAATGDLTVTTPAGAKVRVRLSWSQRSTSAAAKIGAATLSLPAP